jgi:hypothetical protein
MDRVVCWQTLGRRIHPHAPGVPRFCPKRRAERKRRLEPRTTSGSPHPLWAREFRNDRRGVWRRADAGQTPGRYRRREADKPSYRAPTPVQSGSWSEARAPWPRKPKSTPHPGTAATSRPTRRHLAPPRPWRQATALAVPGVGTVGFLVSCPSSRSLAGRAAAVGLRLRGLERIRWFGNRFCDCLHRSQIQARRTTCRRVTPPLFSCRSPEPFPFDLCCRSSPRQPHRSVMTDDGTPSSSLGSRPQFLRRSETSFSSVPAVRVSFWHARPDD